MSAQTTKRHRGRHRPSSMSRPSTSTTKDSIDLDRLKGLPVDELRSLWARHMGRATPPVQKCLLMRELAWRIQERVHGGMDPQTRRLCAAAVSAALSTRDPVRPRSKDEAPPKRAVGMQDKGPSPRVLPSHARLVRRWMGVNHEVVVLNGGHEFRYQDRTYRSLSQIAREITGSHWSGPRFFGLTLRESRKKDMTSDLEGAGNGKRRRARKGDEP